MGHPQHTAASLSAASGSPQLGRRTCLRKGCGCIFRATRWNQRYCGDPECRRLVRRWQAAKRQRRHRQKIENRQRHAQAQRERRRRAKAEGRGATARDNKISPDTTSESSAWSRSKDIPEIFCDRPGCFEPPRPSCRAPARYCGDRCRQAVRRVLDRERKWLKRSTYAGRLKRRLGYRQAWSRTGARQDSSVRTTSGDDPKPVVNYSKDVDPRLSYRASKEHPP